MTEIKRNYLEKIKSLLKNVTNYLIIVLACVSSFLIGFYYKKMSSTPTDILTPIKKTHKSEVNIAIDENSNLIIFDNKTGKYTIYQDSIGKTIFMLYVKNVWGQHTQTPESVK